MPLGLTSPNRISATASPPFSPGFGLRDFEAPNQAFPPPKSGFLPLKIRDLPIVSKKKSTIIEGVKAKLGLNDGKSFGESGEGFMRLNVGTSKEVLEMAMQRLLNAYRSRD